MKKKYCNRVAVGILSATMLLGCVGTLPGRAATEHWNDASSGSAEWTAYKESWSTLSKNYENVSLTPGTDQSKLNFAWYSKTQETPKVRIATNQDALEQGTVFEGSGRAITLEGLTEYYSNKVTVSDLKENTTYYYQVYQDGKWQDAKTYQTKSFDSYSFLYVGDPQIGACTKQTSTENEKMSEDETAGNYAARNDSYNWEKTLNNALANHPEVSFMVSAGDQVNTASSETEYAGYLGASALSFLPVATTIGNHDSKSSQYSLHYNNPNSFDTTDAANEAYTTGATAAGTDYYYTYGDVLFIVLDTNNYNCSTHENVIKKAVEENPDAKWRIVTFHQDIYGSGLDHSDSDGIVLRTQLTPLMDKYDIDVVLQGHDHTYSRTYQLTSDGTEHSSYSSSSTYKAPKAPTKPDATDTTKYPNGENDDTYKSDLAKYETDLAKYTEEKAAYDAFQSDNNCYTMMTDKDDEVDGTVVNPEGSVYFEANSATGSKFYNLISSQQDYIAERSQTWSPSYSVINVSETALTVATYDAKTGAQMEGSSTYTIVKEADKTTLKTDLTSAKAKDTTGYTKASVDAYNAAIQKAESCAANVRVTKSEIAEAASELSKAEAALTGLQDQEITVDSTVTGTVGDKKALGATNKGTGKLSYQSDNEDVAVVSDDGTIRMIGAGTANITVTAAKTDTEKQTSKTVAVTVSAKAASEQPSQASAVKTSTSLKKVTKLKVTTKKNTAKVSYQKVSGASGYEICIAKNKKLNKNVSVVTVSSKVTAKTVKKLAKGKYYVAVRAYKKSGTQTTYGAYSKVKKITIK